jgi:transcriptional regulator with XRE-family HTH domain
MHPSTGTHNLRRLRELLGFQQDGFTAVVHISKSELRKLEHEERPLSRRKAENIGACTGISPQWLLDNDSSEPPIDSRGRPYTKKQFEIARARRLDLRPARKSSITTRTWLLQRYAEARDLFLRPEMRGHLIQFLLDLQLLCARYEQHARYSATDTAQDAISEQHRRENPDNLFQGVIRDAEQCYKEARREGKRLARAEADREKRLAPFLPPGERGKRIIQEKIRQSVIARSKRESTPRNARTRTHRHGQRK